MKTVNGHRIEPRANLTDANLINVDLRYADLWGADLTDANLINVDLRYADLRYADLTRADLTGADLRYANLINVDLRYADLWGVDLRYANLTGANLTRADLTRADLTGTCLDHNNKANGSVAAFDYDDAGNIIGYRSRTTPHIGYYLDGRTYSADFFSTATTECHPGLYLWPTLQQARDWSGPDAEIIQVVANPEHTHQAGSKWRTRWFHVIDSNRTDRRGYPGR